MDRQSKKAVSWLTFFLLVTIAAFAVTFMQLEKAQEKLAALGEELTLSKQPITKQECMLAFDLVDPSKGSLCVYNDGLGHKVVTLKAEDGTTIYGVKPYGRSKITACWH